VEDATVLVFMLVISFLHVWSSFEAHDTDPRIAADKACALVGLGALRVEALARAE
jgi:hypothetical protein